MQINLEIQQNQLQWSEFKGTHLYNGYYFSNTLHIVTQSCCVDYINHKNSDRLNTIYRLHNNGYSNREITDFLNLFGIKRRNKNDNYSVKDVFMCIKKLKKREFRKQNTHYRLDKWELWNTEEFDTQVHHFKQSHILILLP